MQMNDYKFEGIITAYDDNGNIVGAKGKQISTTTDLIHVGDFTNMNNRLVLTQGTIIVNLKITEEGQFDTIYDKIRITNGKTICNDGSIQIGQYYYDLERKQNYLIKGEITYPSGKKEQGDFAYKNNNIYLVQGLKILPDGTRLEGKFYPNKSLSDGKITTQPLGDVYEGQFKFNHRLSQGKITTGTGDVYEGKFKWINTTTYLSEGKVTYKNGIICEGKYIYTNKAGLVTGRIIYPDTDEFYIKCLEGTFNNDGNTPVLVQGKIQYTDDEIVYTNGVLTIIKGKFKEGKFDRVNGKYVHISTTEIDTQPAIIVDNISPLCNSQV